MFAPRFRKLLNTECATVVSGFLISASAFATFPDLLIVLKCSQMWVLENSCSADYMLNTSEVEHNRSLVAQDLGRVSPDMPQL